MYRFGPKLGQLSAVTLSIALAAIMAASSANAAVLFSQGFETDTADWSSATRVASGTDGVTSASGNYHAQSDSGNFSQWGGYNYGAGNNVPTAFQEYWTSIDIFLNVAGGYANNTRFDFSSAISNAAGGFGRDFIFNGGFYNDNDGSPGSGTNRFVISASNNSQPGSAFAKNPGRGPVAISATGWYTFENHFYNNAGVLAVDMRIVDSLNQLVGSWTLSDPTDSIGTIGGNRYGWFDYSEIPKLAIDNAEMHTANLAAVPEPLSLAVWPLIALTIGGVAWCRRNWCASTAS